MSQKSEIRIFSLILLRFLNQLKDLGDCGISKFTDLTEIKLENFKNYETSKITISDRFGNFYFNFSDTEIETIKMAELNSTDVTTWSAVNSQFNIIPVAVDVNQTDSFKFSLKIEYLAKNVTKTAEWDIYVAPVQTTTSPIVIKTLPKIEPYAQNEPKNVVQSESPEISPIVSENLQELIRVVNNSNPEKLAQLTADHDSWILTDAGFYEKLQEASKTFGGRKLLSFHFEKEEEFKDLALKLRDRSQSFKSRKLKDTFGDSLKFVNRLYNQYFG